MEGDAVTVMKSSSSNASVQRGNERIVLEERACPLCSAKIKLFFINYNEKLLMCENTECEFPFGYEDLQLVQVDDADTEMLSIRTKQNFSSPSSVSGMTMSDVDQLYKACEVEDVADTAAPSTTSEPEKINELLQNMTPLKNIHSELIKIKSQMRIKSIKDQKYIKNLYQLQNNSGVRLLQPNELEAIKPEETKDAPEVKIDIDKGDDNVSVIKIELMSPQKDNANSSD